MRKRLLWVLLAVTVVFGFIKQVKTFPGLDGPFLSSSEEHGARFIFLRPLLAGEKARVSYIGDHTKQESGHAAIYYYYDAQYALAPVLIANGKTDAELFVLDFTSAAALEAYVREHQLTLIERQGAVALARRQA